MENISYLPRKCYTAAVVLIVVSILAGHLFADASYLWQENTISELAAQGYAKAWVMRLGFGGFGMFVMIGSAQKLIEKKKYWYRETPLFIYGLGILFSGVFSTKPFLPGVGYSEVEAQIHSIMATIAGFGLSLGILFYLFSEHKGWRKSIHFITLILIMGLSAWFGNAASHIGIIQRCLYLVGFSWLVFVEWSGDVTD